MIKTLALLGALLAVVGGAIFIFARLSSTKVGQTVKQKVEEALPERPTITSPISLPGLSSGSISREEVLKIIDASVSALNKKIDQVSQSKSSTPLVQTQTSSSQTTTSTSPKTLYIPIGYGGSSSSSTDFATVTGHEVTINPSDYPGYKQMVLEATFRIFQGNGTGEVRLLNKTDGTAVLSSIISTTSQDYALKVSSGFTLTSGSKTYTVQAKSSTGYSVDLQLTRIRVDY